MNLLFPKIPGRLVPAMLGITGTGVVLAGFYGMLHDQVTYSMSNEYFTRLKFEQFAYADFGFPPRVQVAEIGFLATWWVGGIVGWFLARVAVPAWPPALAYRKCLYGFALVLLVGMLGACAGYILALRHDGDYSAWRGLCQSLGVTDMPAFVRVAYIHNASYLGGFAGLFLALAWIRHSAPKQKK